MSRFNINKSNNDKEVINLVNTVKSELNSQKNMSSSEKNILDLATGVLNVSPKVKSSPVENKIAAGILDIIRTFIGI